MNGLTFTFASPEKEQCERIVREIKSTPHNRVENDTAADQIISCLVAPPAPSLDCLYCYNGEQLVGLLAFGEKCEKGRCYLRVFNFAVLPPYQRRGIGTSLLQRLKERANDLPIVAGNINEEAIPALEKAGYRRIAKYDYPVYKWSNRPEHQNDWTPFDSEAE